MTIDQIKIGEQYEGTRFDEHTPLRGEAQAIDHVSKTVLLGAYGFTAWFNIDRVRPVNAEQDK